MVGEHRLGARRRWSNTHYFVRAPRNAQKVLFFAGPLAGSERASLLLRNAVCKRRTMTPTPKPPNPPGKLCTRALASRRKIVLNDAGHKACCRRRRCHHRRHSRRRQINANELRACTVQIYAKSHTRKSRWRGLMSLAAVAIRTVSI